MNPERDRYLTEVMGECWHDWVQVGFDDGQGVDFYYSCSKCGATPAPTVLQRNNFSTWQGFGKLKESKELATKIGSSKFRELLHNALEVDCTPDILADAVYKFLKERATREDN